MRCDDFGAVFSRMFGNLYADSPPPPRNIIIGGVYGRHEGVSFRRMHYRGDFSVDFPEPLDEITFVIPSAGKIIFNHATESVGFGQIGLAIGDLSRRFVFCLVSCFLGCPKKQNRTARGPVVCSDEAFVNQYWARTLRVKVRGSP
ncbi:hypothetical protein D3C81_1455570 [compost metagenome]